MTAKELVEWAESLPPGAHIEFMLKEVALREGYADYRVSSEKEKDGGWVKLEGAKLRAVQEHPERRPEQVAERLLR